MTNVIVGIIGVILFIGLALAGAYFLGPKFRQAANNSRAMAVSQAANQVVVAISMRRTEEAVGHVARTPVTTLRSAGFLKALPVNPYLGEGGWPYRALFSADVRSPFYYADIVFVSMGHGEGVSEVCRAVNVQAGTGDQVPRLDEREGANVTSVTDGPLGCFEVHSQGIEGEANAGDFVVYARI